MKKCIIKKISYTLLILLCFLCSITAITLIGSAETEWKISNVVHIQSGGSSNLLKSPDKKMAILYVSPTSKNITDIMLLPGCYFPEENQPIWNVGIQKDNNGMPSGIFLGNGTLENPIDGNWNKIRIYPNVSVTEGDSYWIVIEYLNGPVPNSTDSWLGIYASYAPKDFMHNNIPLPYNYSGEDKNCNDKISYTTVKYYNGSAWRPDPNERNLAVFMVAFEDNTYHGQPYRHNYLSIYGEYMMGQHFVNHDKNRTVNKLEMPWCVFHTDGYLLRPNDSLYYYIMKGDENGELITKGTFLTPDEVYVSGNGNGAGDRKWYNITFEEPITFERDTAYFMYFSSPNSSVNAHWGSDAPNAYLSSDVPNFMVDPLKQTTFDGNVSYSERTAYAKNPWTDNRVDGYGRDMSFRFGFENESITENMTITKNTTIAINQYSKSFTPNQEFTINISISPGTYITGTQLDFIFNSSMTSVNNVTEGDFLKQNGAKTLFSNGTINNSAGTVKNIYGVILGTSNVSSPGTMAAVNLTAGSKKGIAEFSLSNVLISDADSKSVPYTVTNATVLIDTAPVIASIEPKSVDEKSTLTFKVSAKDADCDRLTLSASGLPEGSSFNRTTGNFTWTPERGQAGVYALTFEVSDGYLTDSENVTVTVNKLNNPPVISSFEPLNGSSFSEGERIGISLNASDADGQALNYSIRIDGVVYTTDTEYIWETDYSSSGNHAIEVVASDEIDEVKVQNTIFITDCHPRWDVDENGIVNILDITMVSKNYGTTVNKPYPRYDVNQDGVINVQDLTLVGHHFGELVK